MRQAAAILCGLLLLNVPSAWAAGAKASSAEARKPASRASSSHPHAKAGQKLSRTGVRGVRTMGRNNLKHRKNDSRTPEVLTAELKDDEATGLHGAASFYAYGFHGRRTATGETFKAREFTAASNHFPLGTMVAVRRLDNNLCAIVKVNDRMHAGHRRRIIDVSRGVAEYLDMIRSGVVLVGVAALKHGTRSQDLHACQTAFEAETPPCEDCAATPPHLPEIGGEIRP
ncbi:MAG: septal ring lytic transglycosylase RlpA family protein [Bacteroidota bacterium]